MGVVPNTKSTIPSATSESEGIDLELLVPMARIREHLKVDDIPSVTDDQLSLYRKTAVEQAELYSGFLIGKRKAIREQVSAPSSRARRRNYVHRTRWPVMDDYVQLFGSVEKHHNGPIYVEKGSREVTVPISSLAMDGDICCRPCGSNGVNTHTQIMYYTGYTCADEVPAGIVLGILKFIAWSYSNPGDELLSVQNDVKSRGSTLQGTNNAAWASGALEIWRSYNREAA